MTRVGVIDCGTNATRLLVADVVDSEIVEIARKLTITRMGEDVDAHGAIGHAALDRVGSALRRYVSVCQDLDVERVAALATSAARDASNPGDLIALTKEILNVAPTVLTGEQEAAATHRGALVGLSPKAPTLVIDLGGGSTELAILEGGQLHAVSVAIGSLRLRERVRPGDPPTVGQIQQALAIIDKAVASVRPQLPLERVRGIVAVAGTPLTLGALAAGLDDPDAKALHGAWLRMEDVKQLTEDLLSAPIADVAQLPAVSPGREGVIGWGALILARFVASLELPGMTISRHDLLDDLARQTGAHA